MSVDDVLPPIDLPGESVMWGREVQRRLRDALEELQRAEADLNHLVDWFAVNGGLLEGAIDSMNVYREWNVVTNATTSASTGSGFWVANLPLIEGFTTTSGFVKILNTMSLKSGAGRFGIRVRDLTRGEILIERTGRGISTENPLVTTAGISGRRTSITWLRVPPGTTLRIEQHLQATAAGTSVGASDLTVYSIPEKTS